MMIAGLKEIPGYELRPHECSKDTPRLFERAGRRMPYFVLCGCGAITRYYRMPGVAALQWNAGNIASPGRDDEDRCPHGLFFSGAGACPQCGGGSE